MTRRTIPWDQLRAAYIEGRAVDPDREPFARNWPSLDEVATLFGVALSNVKAKSSKEKWPQLRDEFRLEVERSRRRWVLEQRVERATRVDDRGLSAAEAGLALVGIRLTRMVRDQEGRPDAQRGLGIDSRELAGLGLAAKRFLDTKAHVMGQPTMAGEESLDELEREQVVEERKLAEELARFLEERRTTGDSAPAS